jgi:hypothetical protein
MKDKTLSILDPDFKYTPSSKTNISRTFARIRRELKNQDSKEPLVSPTLNPNGFVLSEEWFQME